MTRMEVVRGQRARLQFASADPDSAHGETIGPRLALIA